MTFTCSFGFKSAKCLDEVESKEKQAKRFLLDYNLLSSYALKLLLQETSNPIVGVVGSALLNISKINFLILRKQLLNKCALKVKQCFQFFFSPLAILWVLFSSLTWLPSNLITTYSSLQYTIYQVCKHTYAIQQLIYMQVLSATVCLDVICNCLTVPNMTEQHVLHVFLTILTIIILVNTD